MKTLIKNILVFLITIVMVFVGAEIYYRFFNQEILGNTGSLSYTRWAQKNFVINSWGFRDKERSVKKLDPKIHRILVFGPSNIVGQGVTNLEDRLSERLEKTLNQNGLQYEVINCGDMTLDPIGSMARILDSMIKKNVEFDSVVFYYTFNTIKHIPEIGNRYFEIKKANEVKKQDNEVAKFLSQNSYAFDWLNNVSQDKRLLIEGKTYTEWHLSFYQNPKYFMEHIKYINMLDKVLKQLGKKFFVLITPISYNPQERSKYQPILDAFKQALTVNSITYTDASKIYDGIPEKDIPVSKYDGHNKPIYYQSMVDILAPQILVSTNKEVL